MITLREAIEAANTDLAAGDAPAGSGADTIDFAGDFNDDKIIVLDRDGLGQIFISDMESLTIDASALKSLTIDANDPSTSNGDGIRIFNIASSAGLVTLDGLTLTGGDSNFDGGAIFTRASLDVRNSTIENNQARNFGGGVVLALSSPGKTYSFTNTTFSNNSAGGNGGAIYANLNDAQMALAA